MILPLVYFFIKREKATILLLIFSLFDFAVYADFCYSLFLILREAFWIMNQKTMNQKLSKKYYVLFLLLAFATRQLMIKYNFNPYYFSLLNIF